MMTKQIHITLQVIAQWTESTPLEKKTKNPGLFFLLSSCTETETRKTKGTWVSRWLGRRIPYSVWIFDGRGACMFYIQGWIKTLGLKWLKLYIVCLVLQKKKNPRCRSLSFHWRAPLVWLQVCGPQSTLGTFVLTIFQFSERFCAQTCCIIQPSRLWFTGEGMVVFKTQRNAGN